MGARSCCTFLTPAAVFVSTIPSGNTLSELTGEVAVGAEVGNPDFLAGITLPAVIQLEVTEQGTYAIELEFGGAWKSLPIHVVHGAPPG